MIGATEVFLLTYNDHYGKRLRLSGYNYGEAGAYFVTICTKDRKPILSYINAGKDCVSPPVVELTSVGALVQKAICSIHEHYPQVAIDQYVIMPNHIHILLQLTGRGNPKLGRIIQQLKGFVTKQSGTPVWQEKYYDHIIRDEQDYMTKAQYIQNNPGKWIEDEYYAEPVAQIIDRR